MDQGDERLDEVFEDERDEAQGWYFDLPSGAWERQEQKNRRLRDTLLNKDKSEEDDLPRDPFTGQPLKRRRFGFGRKKDPREESAKKPRFQKRSSDDEPVSRFRAAGGDESSDDDGWSTEPTMRRAVDENAPLLRRRHSAEDPASTDPKSTDAEDRPKSRWEEMFGGPAAGGSILDGMRDWTRQDSEETDDDELVEAAGDHSSEIESPDDYGLYQSGDGGPEGADEEIGLEALGNRALLAEDDVAFDDEDVRDAAVAEDADGIEAMRAWALRDAPETDIVDHGDETDGDENVVIGDGGLEAMRAWARGERVEADAEDDEAGDADAADDTEAGIEEGGLEEMRAWARGETGEPDADDDEAGVAVTEDDAEVGIEEGGLEAMRAWARGDDVEPETVEDPAESLLAWARGEQPNYQLAVGNDASDSRTDAGNGEGFSVAEGWDRDEHIAEQADPMAWPNDSQAIGSDAAPVPSLEDTGADEEMDATEPPRKKRGFFSRLFGRKGDEVEEATGASPDEELASLVASTGGTGWLDPDGEAGWGSRAGSSAEHRRATIDEDADDTGGWVPVEQAGEPDDELARTEASSTEDWHIAEDEADEDEPSITASMLDAGADDAEETADDSFVTETDTDDPDNPLAWYAAETEASTESNDDATPSDASEQYGGTLRGDEEAASAAWIPVSLADDAEVLEEWVEADEEALRSASAEFDALRSSAESALERGYGGVPGAEPADAAHRAEDRSPWGGAAADDDAFVFSDGDSVEAAVTSADLTRVDAGDDDDEWEWSPELDDDDESVTADDEDRGGIAAASAAGAASMVPSASDDDESALWWAPDETEEEEDPAPLPSAGLDDPDFSSDVEISDEELETALYFAEAYTEEAAADLDVDSEIASRQPMAPPEDDEAIIARYGWSEDVDDEALLALDPEYEPAPDSSEAGPGIEASPLAVDQALDEPAQLQFDFDGNISRVPVTADDTPGGELRNSAHDALVPQEDAEPTASAAMDVDEPDEISDDESVAETGDVAPPVLEDDQDAGWVLPGEDEPDDVLLPAASIADADEPGGSGVEASSARPYADAGGLLRRIAAEQPDEPVYTEGIDVDAIAASFSGHAAAANPVRDSDDEDRGWQLPGEDFDNEDIPAAHAEPVSGDDAAGGPLSWDEREARAPVDRPAEAGSLLSRYAAELSQEPEATGEDESEEDGDAPDLWAAIADEAASSGEDHETSDFDHPRVYGAPGQTTSRMSFYGVRDREDEYTPDENFVPADGEDDKEDNLILRAFEAHAATNVDDDTPEEVEPDPNEFDDLLGTGSQEWVDQSVDHLPSGVSFVQVHEPPPVQARERGDDDWEPTIGGPAPGAATDDRRGGPPLMPYPDIDRPLSSDHSEANKQKTRTLVRELVETGLLALLVFLAVRASFQNFKVDGNSMYPTLEDGQFLIVNKLVYSEVDLERMGNFLPFMNAGDDPTRHVFHGPERGDIVVLRDPSNPSVDLIKRVVGMPGDRLEIYNGAIYINDYLLEEPYIDEPWHDTRPAVLIPDGHYYVLGDNRDNSKDSRSNSIGFVPEDLIVGRAELSYWPFSQFGLAPNDDPTISEAQGRPSVTNQRIERE